MSRKLSIINWSFSNRSEAVVGGEIHCMCRGEGGIERIEGM